ncbi:hypothetical protein BSKO_01002 [Bryopsis sp. KO-2023]|nr:hypothetical protein BSKO_01002 [Bryopsis sp. KO-2023]
MVMRVGKLKVYWNGRIFVGPDSKGLVLSFLLIFLPSVLFLSLIALDISLGVFLYSFLLVMFCIMMLGFTAFSNPGVIPRGQRPTNGARNVVVYPKTQDHQINGYTVTTKYCTTCHVFRIPRCSHCAMCDNCIEKFDHYCPWVGTCIGRRNYRFFLLFVFSATVLSVSVFSLSLFRLVKLSEHHQHSFERAIGREPLAILLIVYTFIAAWFVGGLTVFHMYLVITNQTTYEHFRRRFGRNGNPYDQGTVGNIWETCFQWVAPYAWEGDGTARGRRSQSNRSLSLPPGIILDPTLAAMQHQVKTLSASQELPPRAPSSQTSEKLTSKPMSPCSFGPHPCRVHSISRECELSSLEYQDSIYTTASSNFEEHVQNRLPPLNPSPQGRRSSSLLERDSMASGGHPSELTLTPTASQPTPTTENDPPEEQISVKREAKSAVGTSEGDIVPHTEGADHDAEEELTESGKGGDEITEASTPWQRRHSQSSQGQPSREGPPPNMSLKPAKRRSGEDIGKLEKDGPNPFVSGNPFAIPDEGLGDATELQHPPRSSASLDGVPAMEASAPSNPPQHPENPPTSPSTSAVDSQKGCESPKPFRVMEGGFHGMMVGLTRGRYSELKENPLPQSSDTSESHRSHSVSSKQGDANPATLTTPLPPGPQFRVPEFASKKIGAAIRTFKSASGHLMEKASRGGSVDGGSVVEEPSGVEKPTSLGGDGAGGEMTSDEHRSTWRGVLRRSRRQGEFTDREELREDDVGADVLL